jgi:hypothetical protein
MKNIPTSTIIICNARREIHSAIASQDAELRGGLTERCSDAGISPDRREGWVLRCGAEQIDIFEFGDQQHRELLQAAIGRRQR